MPARKLKSKPIANENVEIESGNEEVRITVPFDPNKIKIISKPYSIGQIIEDVKDGVIDFDTDFQRLPGLWSDQKKSRFIESLLLNLPVPAFYFSEKEENNWEVVDGLQRISTVKQFVIDDVLTLNNLEFLKSYEGQKYSDLPITLQKRITRFQITFYLIEKGTPNDVKYNLFSRINQGGLVLTAQEIRHAVNQGAPAELVSDLVRGRDDLDSNQKIRTRSNSNGTMLELKATKEGVLFQKATDFKVRTERMDDRDFATRFLAFYLVDYTDYQPDMDTFLNHAMGIVKRLSQREISRIKSDFSKSMELAIRIFGREAFRKKFKQNASRKPLNKALFEVLSVAFSKLSDVEAGLLVAAKQVLIEKYIALNNNDRFLRSVTFGTAQKENVDYRHAAIRKLIIETLEYARKNRN